jgi:hypothetical protein
MLLEQPNMRSGHGVMQLSQLLQQLCLASPWAAAWAASDAVLSSRPPGGPCNGAVLHI